MTETSPETRSETGTKKQLRCGRHLENRYDIIAPPPVAHLDESWYPGAEWNAVDSEGRNRYQKNGVIQCGGTERDLRFSPWRTFVFPNQKYTVSQKSSTPNSWR